jgi:Protein of unknown function (DUF3617)
MKSFTRYLAAPAVLVALMVTISGQSRKQNSQPASSSTAKLQPLNVKTGLWESTVTSTRAGELPIPPDTLGKLTPEQRARLEERMKANSGQPTTMMNKSCLKKEDLENPDFTDKKQCTWTTLELTSTRAKGSATCAYPDIGAKLSGTGEIIAVDQEHVKGTIHMTGTASGHKMITDVTFTAKWVGSSCGNVK